MTAELPRREQSGAAANLASPLAPAGFATQLFARAVPEDLARYGAADLAMLAGRAWDFLQARDPGAPKLRCETVALAHSGERKSVAVIDIVNDDMPFLVDSVMAELTDRGLTPRLVVHPILAVARDKTGKLDGAPREAGKNKDETIAHIAKQD